MDNSYPKNGFLNYSEKLISTDRFAVYKENHTLENGTSHDFNVIKAPDWVCTIPLLNENTFLMVWQYRPAWQRSSLEFPAGRLNFKTEKPIDAAKRELQEEIGYNSNSLNKIGDYNPVTWTNQHCFYFEAKDLFQSKLQEDPEEDMLVVKIPITEFLENVNNKNIIDLNTLTGYLMWKNLSS